jgi:hypothetical protein
MPTPSSIVELETFDPIVVELIELDNGNIELEVTELATTELVELNAPGAQLSVGPTLSGGTPQPLGTAAAGDSGAASRSDHVHAHGNQPGGSLHVLADSEAAGFMSSAQAALVDGATDANTPSTLVKRSSTGAVVLGNLTLTRETTASGYEVVLGNDPRLGEELAAVATSGEYDDLLNTPDLTLKADLVNGVVPTSQIPALAVTEFLGEAADEAALLGLSGQRGDWAIRSDTGTTWVLITEGGADLAHWRELSYPAAPVQTVNGQTGTVVLSPADIGAATAAQGDLADSAVQPGDLADVASSGDYNDLSNKPALGGAAGLNVGTTTGTVAAGDDARFHSSVSLAASIEDVLGLSGQQITADDPGADRLLFWDDSESKLTHLALGTNLSISGTTLNAAGGGGGGDIDPIISGMIF